MHPDPGTILTDYDMRDAIYHLRRAGFGTYVMERGTVCAYKNDHSYGFQPRHGRYSKETINRAIAQENAS